jgi:PAS domain S-box-containing protein
MDLPRRDRTILIIDDDRGLTRLIEKALVREGFQVGTAASGEEAVNWLQSNRADLLLLDLKLQDMDGKELIQRLEQLQITIPFIIITGQGDERVAVEMMKRGARDYLVKDVQFLEFVPEVVRNVAEQLETEQRLAAAEERVNLVQSVVEQGFSAVLIASADLPDPQVLYINPSFANLTGYRPEQVVGKPLSALNGMVTVLERLRHGLPPDRRFVEDVSSYTNGATESWVEWRTGPVTDRSGRVTHWLVILRDITERKRLEKEILEINDRVQRRIGQDLHDGLCQQLAGVELMCQVLEQKLKAKAKTDSARLGEIGGHVREAISQARLMARGLSPIVLESEGLMSGLKELASNTENVYGISCQFECDELVLVNDHAAATHLFRIAQEAVSNAIRHGRATQLQVRLKQLDEGLLLEITDNGRGFNSNKNTGGMGLRIMQSRATTIGGKLTIEEGAGGGVRVTCTVALSDAPKHHGSESGGKTQKSEV